MATGTLGLTEVMLNRKNRLQALSDAYQGLGTSEEEPSLMDQILTPEFNKMMDEIGPVPTPTKPEISQSIPQVIGNELFGAYRFASGVGEGIVGVGSKILGGSIGAIQLFGDLVKEDVDIFAQTGNIPGTEGSAKIYQDEKIYSRLFKRMQETAQKFSYSPKTPTGELVDKAVMYIPNAISEVIDYTTDSLKERGLHPESAVIINEGLKLSMLWAADRGFRSGARKIRSKIHDNNIVWEKIIWPTEADLARLKRNMDRIKDDFDSDPKLLESYTEGTKGLFNPDPNAPTKFGPRGNYKVTPEIKPENQPEVKFTREELIRGSELARQRREADSLARDLKLPPNELLAPVIREPNPDIPLVPSTGGFVAPRKPSSEGYSAPEIPKRNFDPVGELIRKRKERGQQTGEINLVETPEQRVDRLTREQEIRENTPVYRDDPPIQPVQQTPVAPINLIPNISSFPGMSIGPGFIKPTPLVPGKSLYHETNIDGLKEIIQSDKQLTYGSVFVSDNPDLAIGQGGNKGIKIEFRPDSLSGKENLKPGTQMEGVGKEYKTDLHAPNAVNSLIIPKGTRGIPNSILSKLMREFDLEVLPNGDRKFIRKGELGGVESGLRYEIQEPNLPIQEPSIALAETSISPIVEPIPQIQPTKLQRNIELALNPSSSKDISTSALREIKGILNEFKSRKESQQKSLERLGISLEQASKLIPKLRGVRTPKALVVEPVSLSPEEMQTELSGSSSVIKKPKSQPVQPIELIKPTELIESTGQKPLANYQLEALKRRVEQKSGTLSPEEIITQAGFGDQVGEIMGKLGIKPSQNELTNQQKLQLSEEINKPISPEILDPIIQSIEERIDISDQLPENIKSQYQALLEEHKTAIESSEGRSVKDIIGDILNLIPKPQQELRTNLNSPPGELGAIGRWGFDNSQRLSLQRLEADARRLGKSVRSLLQGLGKSPAEITLAENYLSSINNPIPPSSLTPTNMRIDPIALRNNDPVVKQRKIGQRVFPEIYQSENEMIQNAKSVAPTNKRELIASAFQNPYYTLRQAGLEPIHFAYRLVERSLHRETSEMVREMSKLRGNISRESERAIWAYGYSLDPKGRKINAESGVVPRPLTPRENEIFLNIRNTFEAFYKRNNENRIATGREPLPYIDNYITMGREFTRAEKSGVQPNQVLNSPNILNSKFVDAGATRFPYDKRTGLIYKGDYRGLDIMEQYLRSSIRDIYRSPFIAKLSELIDTKLPSLKTGEENWLLEDHNKSLHTFLSKWNNRIAGVPNFTFDQIMPSDHARLAENISNRLQQNMAISVLSFSVQSGLNQFGSLPKIVHASGFGNFSKAVGELIGDAITGYKFTKDDWRSSHLLDSSQIDASAMGLVSSLNDVVRNLKNATYRNLKGGEIIGTLGDTQRAIGNLGFLFMKYMDATNKILAYKAGKHLALSQGLKGDDLIRKADDILLMTQGSSHIGDLAEIQGNTFGKLVTLFQTYQIADWNYLMHEVLNVGGKSQRQTYFGKPGSYSNSLLGAIKFMLATGAVNSIYQQLFGVQSPLPTPIDDLNKNLDISQKEGEDNLDTAFRVGIGLFGNQLEVTPLFGSTKFGKGPGGPINSALDEAARSSTFRPMSKPLYEPVLDLGGAPILHQYFKGRRAEKRGEVFPYTILNKYDPEVGKSGRKRKRSNQADYLK